MGRRSTGSEFITSFTFALVCVSVRRNICGWVSFKMLMREFFFPLSPLILVYSIFHVSLPSVVSLWALLLLYHASSDGGSDEERSDGGCCCSN